jgi:hypothetical protein
MHCLDIQIKKKKEKKRIISKTKIKAIIKIQKKKNNNNIYWIVKNSINECGCVRSGNNVRVT